MPRVSRLTKTDEALALDAAARAFKRVEAQVELARKTLHEAIGAAVQSGMSKSEAGRRAGYTREYVASIIDKLPKHDDSAAQKD